MDGTLLVWGPWMCSLLLAQPPADPARQPSPRVPVLADSLAAARSQGNQVLPHSVHPRPMLLGEMRGLGGCRGKQQTGCSRGGVSGFGLASLSQVASLLEAQYVPL